MTMDVNKRANDQAANRNLRRPGLIAAGGILGAIAASSCCIVPLILFSFGMGGAWLGNLSALTPYQPYFIAFTIAALGYGFYLVYRRPKACTPEAACSRPLPNRMVKTTLWVATVVVIAAGAFPYVAPGLLGIPA